jgi:hypothetical protein
MEVVPITNHSTQILSGMHLSHYSGLVAMHPQLLEGLKEESRIEDNEKREGVGARSLTRSTKGVEGCAKVPGLGLGRVTSLIHLL